MGPGGGHMGPGGGHMGPGGGHMGMGGGNQGMEAYGGMHGMGGSGAFSGGNSMSPEFGMGSFGQYPNWQSGGRHPSDANIPNLVKLNL